MIALENKRKEKEKLSKNIINESFKNNLLKVYGNKGSIFAEDTGGLHRGTKIVKNEPRLLLQYLFTPYDNKRKNVDISYLVKNNYENKNRGPYTCIFQTTSFPKYFSKEGVNI